jgi:hypothetical protein
MLIQDRVFATSRAQFPRSWYTGQVTAVDLFGEMPEHFADFDLAFSCQSRHAVELAKKDVAKGAAFSDVREQAEGTNITNFQYRGAANQPGGTVYWVDTQSGELRRYENLVRNPNVNPAAYQFEGTQVVPTHETPERNPASTSGAVAPTSPATAAAPVSKPVYGMHNLSDRVALAMAQTTRYAQAGVIYAFAFEGWEMIDTPAVRAAVKEAVNKCTPLLESRGARDLSVASGPDGQYELRHVLPALLTLRDEVLTTLHDSFVAECIRTSMSIQGVAALSTVVPGARFVLDEPYLKRCTSEALLELWSDAELPPESNASDEDLRAMLLEEAPALAERGWLPRPLAVDVELEVRGCVLCGGGGTEGAAQSESPGLTVAVIGVWASCAVLLAQQLMAVDLKSRRVPEA